MVSVLPNVSSPAHVKHKCFCPPSASWSSYIMTSLMWMSDTIWFISLLKFSSENFPPTLAVMIKLFHTLNLVPVLVGPLHSKTQSWYCFKAHWRPKRFLKLSLRWADRNSNLTQLRTMLIFNNIELWGILRDFSLHSDANYQKKQDFQ